MRRPAASRASARAALVPARLPEALAVEVPPVVVLAGAERFLRDEGLAAVVARVLPEGDPGASYLHLDARRPEDREQVSAAMDELRSPALFGGRKVVAIQNAEGAAGPWAAGRESPVTRLAREGMAAGGTAGVLVLLTSRSVKGSGGLPAGVFETGALVVDCRAPYDAPAPWEHGRAPWDHELARWVVARLKGRHGRRIAPEDAHALTRLVGTDLDDLARALDTLSLYVGTASEVRGEDLEQALGATRTDPAWRLTDAVLGGNVEGALDLLEQAFRRGLPDGRGGLVHRPEALCALLLAALHGAWRQVLQGAEALARDQDAGEMLRGLGVPRFRADAFLARCRRDPERLLARHGAFLAAEAGVKGGGVSPRLALERLVIAIAG